MTLRRTAAVLLPLVLLALSCASPNRLARQSDQALARGDLRKAYETARRALNKDAANVNARSAFGAAARQLGDDYKDRVLRLAMADTVAAARVALDYRDLRNEIARYPVQVPEDSLYLGHERTILHDAAATLYADAEVSLSAGQPKQAYRQFLEAESFDPGYHDVGRRVTDAFQRALTKVAVLPFENQVHIDGLPQMVQQHIAGELVKRSGSPAFQFTRVVDLGAIDARMTVAEARSMTREQARSLGRSVGADRVVYGRITALRTSSDSHDHVFPIYHAESVATPQGDTQERWVESLLRVVVRERHVSVTCEYEVVDVRTGAVRAGDSLPFDSGARVVWSDDLGDGDAERYHLVPEDMAKADEDHAKRVEAEWNNAMGDWSLPEFLSAARADDRRTQWDSRRRAEFARENSHRPVFLGELPRESDLAFLALERSWEPVVASLRALDPED